MYYSLKIPIHIHVEVENLRPNHIHIWKLTKSSHLSAKRISDVYVGALCVWLRGGMEICISQLMNLLNKHDIITYIFNITTRLVLDINLILFQDKEIFFGFRFSCGVLFHCAVDVAASGQLLIRHGYPQRTIKATCSLNNNLQYTTFFKESISSRNNTF